MAEEKRPFDWTKAGYGLTALWMIVVLTVTGADPRHPFFDYIFIVPLACWLVAAVVTRLFGKKE